MKRLLFCVSLLAVTSCKKTFFIDFTPAVTTLPAITSEGKRTFGCLVNNSIWVPSEYKDRVSCEYLLWKDGGNYYGSLSIRSMKRHFHNDNSCGLNMTLHNRIFTTGKAPLFENDNTKDYMFLDMDTGYYSNFKPSQDNFINISRLDTVNRIISGTFQCTLVNLYPPRDTVRITEGRFDLRF